MFTAYSLCTTLINSPQAVQQANDASKRTMRAASGLVVVSHGRQSKSSLPRCMPMFLRTDELIELTHRRRSDAQARTLREMGIEHRLRADGTVAVLRVHVEKLFGAANTSEMREQDLEPNWSAM